MTYSITPKTAVPKADSTKSISNRKLYPAIAGGLLVALAAGAALKLIYGNRAVSTSESAASIVATTESSPAADPELFQSAPFFKPSAPTRLADPALLKSTSAPVRVQTVAAGRTDPFASVIVPGPASSRPAPATPVTAVTPAQPLPVVPVVATQSLPSLPPLLPSLPSLPSPFVPGSAAQNPTAVAVAPTASPTFQSLVDQIVVSGVVQIGNDVSLIVTEPGNATSRRVSKGDLLAGGRVRIKSVDLSSQEPVVVLTYDGTDYTRIVGDNAMIGAL